MSKFEYKAKLRDLQKCFNFAIKYHLDERKGSSNRTTGQYRGLGGIFDSFVIGKFIEIGVASIIEKISKKKMKLDFAIHEINTEDPDPDIVGVIEKGKTRLPKLFIEIKNISINDRWVGLTVEQFNSLLKSNIASNDPRKIFIIYASLHSKNDWKNSDLLGVYLKTKRISNKILDEFCRINDLYVEIHYILRGNELENQGACFHEGSYMYETEIFEEVTPTTAKKVIDPNNRYIYKLLKSSKVLPIIMRNNYPKPKEFGKFFFKGKLRVYKKKNPKSNRMYVYCKTNVHVKNEVLGNFFLDKGKVYECFFTTLGRSPTLKRNNIWIAQRNLGNVSSSSLNSRVKKIAKTI